MEPFRFRLRVRYNECDAQGIVFNARWGDYVDIALTEYGRALFGAADVAATGLDWRLVKQTTEWDAPARFDDVLDIRVRTLRIGTTSFALGFELDPRRHRARARRDDLRDGRRRRRQAGGPTARARRPRARRARGRGRPRRIGYPAGTSMSRAKSILLVEDNPDDVELTRRAFHRNKILNEVIVATDGEEALTYLMAPDNPKPAFVLLDLKLPKVSGLDVLRQMRASERTKRLPVVVLTSSNEERDIVTSYDLGANSFVRKPVDFAEFLEAVRQLGIYWLLLNEAADELR